MKTRGRPVKYPLATMRVGECFSIEIWNLENFRAYISGRGKALGRRFTVNVLWRSGTVTAVRVTRLRAKRRR